jgi:hypothetical protein
MDPGLRVFLGGPVHGKVLFCGPQPIWQVAIPPKPIFTPEPQPRSLADCMQTATYEMRVLGMKGTQRRMEYMVLAILSEKAFLALAEAYENS